LTKLISVRWGGATKLKEKTGFKKHLSAGEGSQDGRRLCKKPEKRGGWIEPTSHLTRLHAYNIERDLRLPAIEGVDSTGWGGRKKKRDLREKSVEKND